MDEYYIVKLLGKGSEGSVICCQGNFNFYLFYTNFMFSKA